MLMWTPNDPLWVIAYLGGLRLGATLVPLDASSTAELVAEVVRQTEPRLAIVGSEAQRKRLPDGIAVLDLAAFEGPASPSQSSFSGYQRGCQLR